ncbi:MAG TPA: ATP-binding protein [Syntrophorhabdaceae bacterium]|nr:ATP-binding protein [Syntrophorhabdaceae bacterium]
MKRRSEQPDDWDALRAKIIGLGEQSIQKSYYPELQRRLEDFKRFRVLLDQSIDGIVLACVPTGVLADVNESICNQSGYSRRELIGMSFMDLVLPNESSQISELLSKQAVSRQGINIEISLRKKNGDLVPVEMTARLVEVGGSVYAVAVMRDITDRIRTVEEKKKLETQLHQSQKMEAIGRLAGGIAHDFNNILTALTGYGSLLQMKMDKDDPLLMYVDQILSASQKAADLTQSLLAFSRQQPVTFASHDINKIIRGSEKLLKRLVTEDVVIRTILAPKQPAIMTDATQIDQVLFNLASNARDAMPKGGVLTIETKQVELDNEIMTVHGYGKPGKYVLVSISDTGTGMDEPEKEKIFDPFYTTKEVGKGTGLGLSTVYGIVKQHEGYITVDSEPGAGTTFHLYFPAACGTAEKERPPQAPARGGNEAILIAEDNAAVRSLMREVLSQYGYSIVEAVDGTDAIEQFNRSGEIDLLILDSVMPGKNGREVYNEINNIKPGIRVLFTSGYTRDIVLDKGIEDRNFHFISKPVQPIALLNKVREVLEE